MSVLSVGRRLISYARAHGLYLLAAACALEVARALPSFALFGDRAPGMLQLHLLEELFAVIVAILVSVIAWHDLEQRKDSDCGVLVAGFTAVAIIDLVHALTYEGMPPLVIENSTQRAVFFWLAGRGCAAVTLLWFALGLRIRLPRGVWLGGGIAVAAGAFAVGTWELGWIPPLFESGLGLTMAKRHSEYVLVAVDVLTALLFVARPSGRPQVQTWMLASSCLTLAMAEVVFANWKAPSDFINNFGHVFKLVAYAMLYQSVFVAAIRAPYRQLRESEARFRSLTQLSADWFWRLDANGRFLEVSPGAAVLGIRPLIGLRPWDVAARAEAPGDWDRFITVCSRQAELRALRLPFQSGHGTVQWFAVSCSPIFDQAGQFEGLRGVCSDITDRVRSERQTEYLAFHDPLTGLPNRLFAQRRFAEACARRTPDSGQIAFLFIDIDNFKLFNDSLGHAAGDEVLRAVTQRILAVVPENDLVARLGGDELLVIAAGLAGRDPAMALAARVIAAVRQPFTIEGREHDVTVSIGIGIHPDDGGDFESLRRSADVAMYRAKQAGRDTVLFHDHSMGLDANRLALRSALRQALDHEQFELHFQPQIRLATGEVIGAEALVRWNHPERGLLGPGEFIALAEEFGLIIPLGEWVLRAACREAVHWRAENGRILKVAVNCSALQFRRGTIEDAVRSALADSGLAPQHLELELTESILIQDVDLVMQTISRLQSIGVGCAMDDFGTGYSSLSYLKELAVDTLKIDRSFVRDLLKDPGDASIVKTIIQLAHNLGQTALAEGVEDARTAEALAALGCDAAQGYHFACPMPALQFRTWLATAQSPSASASSWPRAVTASPRRS